MSINRTSFKGYNRGRDRRNIDDEIFFDELDWHDDPYDWYDDHYDYYDDWEEDLGCFREREYNEETMVAILEAFEIEQMRYDCE